MREILNKILDTSNEELDKIDMSFYERYNFWHDTSYYMKPSGKEHYRLLTYISTLFANKTVYDVGTNRCMSACALSSSYTTRVKSYDIIQILPMNPILPNVIFKLGDVTTDEKLIKSNFIFLDVNHDGIFENIFYNHLKKIKWKGILMLDDIHLNEPMKEFYSSIEEEKYDITNIGHWSGSSVCLFE